MSTDQQEEISLKEFIIKIKDWVAYLCKKKNICIIVSVALICAIIGFVYAWRSKPVYRTKTTFVLMSGNNGGGGSSLGGLASLAGMAGLNISAGGESGVFSATNIAPLITSKKMLRDALLSQTKEGKVLINIFATQNKMWLKWAKNERTKNVYPFPGNIDSITPVQDSIIAEVCEMIGAEKSKILQIGIAKDSKKGGNIFTLETEFPNEEFAFYFSRSIVASTTRFYIDTKTSVAKSNLQLIKEETDSLRTELEKAAKTTGYDAENNFSSNPAFMIRRATMQINQAYLSALSGAYAEGLKQLEIAKMGVLKEMPLYQIIDEPHMPLKVTKASKRISIMLGAVLGGFLATVVLVLRRLYQKIMQEE